MLNERSKKSPNLGLLLSYYLSGTIINSLKEVTPEKIAVPVIIDGALSKI